MTTEQIAGCRARAAMEYAGYSWKRLAKEANLSPSTTRRILSRAAPRGFDKREEWEAIADACKVPRWFFEHGFEGALAEADEPALTERVEALEQQVQTLLRLIATRAGIAAGDSSQQEPDASLGDG